MEGDKHFREEGRSLAVTPTWAVGTVITVMVAFGFFCHRSLKQFGKWLDKTKRKSLLAALEKIKEELMVFGLLSLLMSHWIVFVAKICVKSSMLSSKFYPCEVKNNARSLEHIIGPNSNYLNHSVYRQQVNVRHNEYCPEGHESFASHESLEQLHRFAFVLGVTHVSYSFIAIALAMSKIYSWRVWENQAKTMAIQRRQDPQAASNSKEMRRLSTFIFHHTSHPWSQHGIFVWLLCFSRQFWSSINRADYMALRLGFITTHQLPLTYDFHNYMIRSMEEEFRDIVGISLPLWIYVIICIFLNFHGTHVYFWLSFLPAILVLLMGTKMHRIVVKLAVEIMDKCPWVGNHHFNLRDDLFWFGKPKLLLWLIKFISFQNAFEMSSFLWSMWEIHEPSCFMDNRKFVVIRLTFGIISQFWCSFITFPLYVIITQMGSRFKKSVVSENVRQSLSKWQRRVKARQSSASPLLKPSTASSDSVVDDMNTSDTFDSSNMERSSSRIEDLSVSSHQEASVSQSTIFDRSSSDEKLLNNSFSSNPLCDSDSGEDDEINDVKDDSCLFP
ncbi:Mlo domain-containing protein [Cephalotus follicularis]|uniref:MLO-like protein n=1 Tax=Cephalotus follicularis TaxID=3775 RepID=A0A1Q3BA29_CEPFO|nr:Mlo domain-containing protein [Cephalotus follicularis]